MGNITEILSNIKNAVFGKDVRQNIHDGIKQCYEDAIANGHTDMEVIEARGKHKNLNERLEVDKTDVETQIENESTNRKNFDANLQSQINGLASGSPLAASSVSEMTDTTKVYVNTADGHWYYWNGMAWTDGGVYQSTEIADNGVTLAKLGTEFKETVPPSNNYLDVSKAIEGKTISTSSSATINTDGSTNKYMTLYPVIEVEPNQQWIALDDLGQGVKLSAFQRFDNTGKVIDYITVNADDIITIPENCYYIRIGNLTDRNLKQFKRYDVSEFTRDYEEYRPEGEKIIFLTETEVKNIIGHNKLIGLDSISSVYPVITFIDDDGSMNFYNTNKAVFDNHNCKCTEAIVVDWVGQNNRMTLDQLKEIQTDGIEIVGHSKTHGEIWRNPLNSASADLLEEAEITFNFLLDNNFNCDVLVYPFGSGAGWDTKAKTKVSRLLKKAGFSCGVLASGSNGNSGLLNPYLLKRNFLNKSTDIQTYKDKIDECIANNTWLIFGLHSGSTTEIDATYLDQILTYIDSKGVQVKTFTEAFNQRKNICSQGIIGKGSYTYIDRQGNITF